MKLSEILYQEDYSICEVSEDIQIEKIATKPEEVEKNTLLIIPNSSKIQKEMTFVTPPLAIACDKADIIPSGIPIIKLENPRLTLSRAFYRFFEIKSCRFKIIGITGTNGKTSTAYFLKTVLLEQGKRVGYIGTGIIEIAGETVSGGQYSMTTPDAGQLYGTLRLMQNEKCDVVIMEVSSHALALEKVEPLFFDYAVFTNLSNEHSDFHGTMDDYFQAKCKLFRQCKTAIFNLDDEYARRALTLSEAQKNITVGVLHKGEIYATHIENEGYEGVSYLYRTDDFMFKMKVNIPGIYNVYNSLLASAVCIDMGCPPCEVKSAVRKLKSIPGRFDLVRDDVTVIIDFAHTEAAFESFLREARRLASPSKLSVVFGCGGERDKNKRPKMAAIAEKYADSVTVTTDNPRNEDPKNITKDIVKGFCKSSYTVINDRKKAITDAVSSSEKGGVIAIVGKGAEKYIIDKDGYHAFDEMEIVKEALLLRKGRT